MEDFSDGASPLLHAIMVIVVCVAAGGAGCVVWGAGLFLLFLCIFDGICMQWHILVGCDLGTLASCFDFVAVDVFW